MIPPRTDSESRGEPYRVLLVCTGNTCRSPMARVILESALARRGWSQVVEVRSAGVGAYPGSPATGEAVRVAKRRGLDLSGHESTPLDEELVEWADLILTMSPSHLAPVAWAGGGERAAVITAFARGGEGDPQAAGEGVLDPFGGAESVYEATFLELEELVEKVLDRLEPILPR